MATLKNTFNTVAFPHEFDHISIEGSGSCEVVIKIGGAVIYRSTLYFDEDGFIDIDNFADVIRTYVTNDKANFSVSIDGGNNWESTVMLPCSVELQGTAEDFVSQHFLTRCEGVKHTYPGCKESVSGYALHVPVPGAVIATYMLHGVKTAVEVKSFQVADAGYFLYTYDVDEIAALHEGDLVGFSVRIGARSLDFIVDNALPAESVLFRNCFGRPETFAFPYMETKMVVAYQAANIKGKLVNYITKRHREMKCSSGYLLPGEIGLFEDVMAAEEIKLMSTEVPVVVTAADLTRKSDFALSVKGSVTLRESGNVPYVKPKMPVNTFDNTFDKTFR